MRRLSLLFLLTLIASPVRAETHLEYILDVSGSMAEKLGAEQQIDSARSALLDSLAAIPANEKVALRVFGHRVEKSNKDESCKDTELIFPFAPVSSGAIATKVFRLAPKGYTPIAYSLLQAKNDFPAEDHAEQPSRAIVLLSDGEETCGGDPVAVIKKLRAEGFSVTVYTIGFNVNEIARQQLKGVAEATGGKYYDAKDAAELKAAFQDATKTSMVIDKQKRSYGDTEIRGGDSYETAVSVPLNAELRLDHHQRQEYFDYFALDLTDADELKIELKTQELGVSIDDGGNATPASNCPNITAIVHDSSRNELAKFAIHCHSFKTTADYFRPASAGRYYLLIGSSSGFAMNKDHSSFKLSLRKIGDLDGELDAGETLATAMPITNGAFAASHLGGGDKQDVYTFEAKRNDVLQLTLVPEEDDIQSYKISVVNELKNTIVDQYQSSTGGMRLKDIKLEEDGRYYIVIDTSSREQFFTYRLNFEAKQPQ